VLYWSVGGPDECWSLAGRGKQKCLKKSLLQCHRVYHVRNVGLETTQVTARLWMDQHWAYMSKYHLRTLCAICSSHHGVVEGSCLLDVALYSCGHCGGRQCPLLVHLLAPHSTSPLGVVYSYTKTLPSALHYCPLSLLALWSLSTLITHPMLLSCYSFHTTKPWRWRQYDLLKGWEIPKVTVAHPWDLNLNNTLLFEREKVEMYM
jgi:hypothetical protein